MSAEPRPIAPPGLTAARGLMPTPHEFGEEHSRSHGQEQAHSRNAYRRANSEVCTSNKMAAETIPNQKVKNDNIEQARDQARRIGFETDSPIQVYGEHVSDESGHED